MVIHQVLANASSGDAITNSALRIRSLLRKVGPSEIFARASSPDLADEIIPIQEFGFERSAHPSEDLILYHMSIGEPEVFRMLNSRPERVGLIYHNLAPAERFWAYDPLFAGLLEAGRQELIELRERVSFAIADSEFNAKDLRDIGYQNVQVSPLIVDVSTDFSDADEETRKVIREMDGPQILFVGQKLPHKRPELLLMAYHYLVTYLDPTAHLALIGHSRLEPFTYSVNTFAKELNLSRLWMAGPITPEQLAAFYVESKIFVTVSDHEGFCVPLLEAMDVGLPILARSCGAIPETLGDAGVLLPEDASPALIAEAMHAMLNDAALCDTFVKRGHDRLRQFRPEVTEPEFLRHLLAAV